jgi:hypothetical protein
VKIDADTIVKLHRARGHVKRLSSQSPARRKKISDSLSDRDVRDDLAVLSLFLWEMLREVEVTVRVEEVAKA